jgi:hypothetical protein
MTLNRELATAGVNGADIKRLGRLLRKAEDSTSAAAIVRYVAGISPKKPPRGESWYYKAELVAALHDARQLTHWDERILELFATKDMDLLLELRDWIPKQIAKYPDEDIAGNILAAAKKLDIYGSEYLFHAITLQRYTNGKLNSGGRWLLARARDSYAKLVKAFPHKPGSDFTLFLAVEAPDLYAKHRAKLPSVRDEDIAEARRKSSGAPKAKEAKPKAKVAKPKAGYAFDRYAAAVVKEFTRVLDDELTDIHALRVYVPQSRTLPEVIIVETDEQHVYSVAEPAGPLQESTTVTMRCSRGSTRTSRSRSRGATTTSCRRRSSITSSFVPRTCSARRCARRTASHKGRRSACRSTTRTSTTRRRSRSRRRRSSRGFHPRRAKRWRLRATPIKLRRAG